MAASSPSPSSSPSAAAGGSSGGAAISPSPLHLPLPAPPPPSSTRRLPPPCWTNEETLALIDSYREKWYSLRRGNLRASHWEEVAPSVVARCRLLPSASPKTPVQCRHKIEKLRKRYRSEKQRSISLNPSSSWIFFKKLDAMEFGGTASGSAAASRSAATSRSAAALPDSDDDDADDGGGGGGARNNSGSIHRVMANGGGGAGGGIGGLRFKIPKAVRSKIVGSRSEEKTAWNGPNLNPNPSSRLFRGFAGMDDVRRRTEERRRLKKRRKEETEGNAVGDMVNTLRMLGDGYMRMEQMKMEMARDMEKVRMEMELKRTEMILDWQRRIVDSFVKGFAGKKRISPED